MEEKPFTKKANFLLLVALAAALVFSYQYTTTMAAVSPTTVAKLNKWAGLDDCTYIVFSDGTNTYAKDCDDGSIDSTNTAASTVMQYAIDNMNAGDKLIIRDVSTFATTVTINDEYMNIEIRPLLAYSGTGYAFKVTGSGNTIHGSGRIQPASTATGAFLIENSSHNNLDIAVDGAGKAFNQIGFMIDRTASNTAAYWNKIDSHYLANVGTGIKIGDETHSRANANHIGDVIIRNVNTGIDFNHGQGSTALYADIEGYATTAVRNNDIQNHVRGRGEAGFAGTAPFFTNTANANSFYYILMDTTSSPKIVNADLTIEGTLVEGAQTRTFGDVEQRTFGAVTLFDSYDGVVVLPNSTSFVTVLPRETTKMPFDHVRPLNARLIVVASANDTGSATGVSVYDVTAGAQLAEATWSGTGVQAPKVGSWTAMTTATDSVLIIRAKGDTITEKLTIYHIELQFY